ncbi:hypothetical protein BD413DRAFT_165220 [Trametes elegans]|nr:hypothetical protein BD413DRAFT_165220 [Trametes elegans]
MPAYARQSLTAVQGLRRTCGSSAWSDSQGLLSTAPASASDTTDMVSSQGSETDGGGERLVSDTLPSEGDNAVGDTEADDPAERSYFDVVDAAFARLRRCGGSPRLAEDATDFAPCFLRCAISTLMSSRTRDCASGSRPSFLPAAVGPLTIILQFFVPALPAR